MLLLTNVAGTAPDKVRIVTSASATLDVHASWADNNAGSITLGRTNTAISTPTTTDIVAAPASGVIRNVKTLHARNKHATLSDGVTVTYDQNGTVFELFNATLLAGQSLEYVEGIGFFVTPGLVSATTRVKALTADQSNSTTTLTDVTGLDVTTGTGTFTFRHDIIYQAAAATTGVRFSVNHSGTVTSFVANEYFTDLIGTASSATPSQANVLAAATVFGVFSARAKSNAGWGTTLSVDTAGADMYAVIEGIMVVTVDGAIQLWHGSEVAAASTVKAGSALTLTRVGD